MEANKTIQCKIQNMTNTVAMYDNKKYLLRRVGTVRRKEILSRLKTDADQMKKMKVKLRPRFKSPIPVGQHNLTHDMYLINNQRVNSPQNKRTMYLLVGSKLASTPQKRVRFVSDKRILLNDNILFTDNSYKSPPKLNSRYTNIDDSELPPSTNEKQMEKDNLSRLMSMYSNSKPSSCRVEVSNTKDDSFTGSNISQKSQTRNNWSQYKPSNVVVEARKCMKNSDEDSATSQPVPLSSIAVTKARKLYGQRKTHSECIEDMPNPEMDKKKSKFGPQNGSPTKKNSFSVIDDMFKSEDFTRSKLSPNRRRQRVAQLNSILSDSNYMD